MSDEAVHISKDAQVLRFFVAKKGRINRTEHIKLAYMADLVARQYLGRPITSFAYRYDKHGPFDKAFYDARTELAENGLAKKTLTSYGDYWGRTLVNLEKTFVSDLSAVEEMVLEFVYSRYGRMPLKKLLREVKATEPMKRAEKGKPVPMDVVNNRGRDEAGYDLEALSKAQERIDSGRFLTHDELFSGIRAALRR